MPRKARLDAHRALHHVMVRGIERLSIVNDVASRLCCDLLQSASSAQGAFTSKSLQVDYL
jgi:hypothetical protein